MIFKLPLTLEWFQLSPEGDAEITTDFGKELDAKLMVTAEEGSS
jgi:hypothetical protein